MAVPIPYPTAEKLINADFLMNFNDNNYNGEKQIREVLKQKQKFTEDTGQTSPRFDSHAQRGNGSLE